VTARFDRSEGRFDREEVVGEPPRPEQAAAAGPLQDLLVTKDLPGSFAHRDNDRVGHVSQPVVDGDE
jgi:hypothetical protein